MERWESEETVKIKEVENDSVCISVY
jgi:hypothetical protein